MIARRGRPLSCVSDNGTGLTNMAILRWCQERGIERHYIAPGNQPPAIYAKLSVPAMQRGPRAPSRCAPEPDKLKCGTDSAHPWMNVGA